MENQEVIPAGVKTSKKTKQSSELSVSVQQMSPIEILIEKAISSNMDMDKLQALLDMHKNWKKDQAKEAFDIALADFQTECPIITKDKHVKFSTKNGGSADYRYAPIDSIIRQVAGLLGKNGFSYKFRLEELPTGIKATCILTHKLGHAEESDFTANMAGTGLMSDAQLKSSKATFAKRNAFCNVTGIVTGDEDNDAALTKEEVVIGNSATQEQKDQIDALAIQANMTKADVVQRCRELYGISYTEISKIQADGIIVGLKKRIEKATV